MKSSQKSTKSNKEFRLTKSTRFSENNIKDTIASSIRAISKFKSRKKEKPIFLNLEDFHKQFLLNKNKDEVLSNNCLPNEFNSIYNIVKTVSISDSTSNKKNIISLKKSLFSLLFFLLLKLIQEIYY